MNRRPIVPRVAALLALIVLGSASLFAQKPQSDKRLAKETESGAAVDANNVTNTMQRTRGDFLVLLQLHPRILGAVYHDPSLLADADYLKKNASDLAAFIEQHPEVAQDSEFFLGPDVQRVHDEESRGRRPGEYSPTMRILDFIGPFIVFVIITGVLIWMIKFFVENRRWNKLAKAQQDVYTKLMDKLSSSQDLQAYMETARRFLGSAPIPVEMEQKTRISAPVGRMLWSVQAGVILAMGSLGFFFARSYAGEAAPALTVLGTLGVMLGLGFVVAAGASYLLSRHLGLFENPTSGPAA